MRGTIYQTAHAFRAQKEHIHLRGQRLVLPVADCHQMQNGRVLQHQTHAHGDVTRDIICPMAHVPNAKQDITAPGTTVEDNVQVQHIRMKQEKRHVNHAQPQQNMLRWYHTIGIGHQMV